MKIVFKKDDGKSISGISDKLSTIAKIEKSGDKKRIQKKEDKSVKIQDDGGKLLKRNLNSFLLIVLILFICAGIGLAVFYMHLIKDVSGQKHELDNSLTSCTASLENYMEALALAESELNATSADIKKYDALYEEKAGMVGELEEGLSSATAELAATKTLLDKAAEDLTRAQSDVAGLTAERNTLAARVKQLESDVLALEIIVNQLQQDLAECE